MEDITPGLLKAIQDDFQTKFNKSEVISALYAKVRDGTASYVEANDFALEVGELLASAYQNNISSSILPDGKMYYNIANRILNPTMKNNYNLITEVTKQVQKALNEQAGIGIKPIVPELNQDRIDGIVNRVSAEEIFDNVAWILAEPIVNFSQSIVDDSIRENVKFHADAGMTPKIVRKLMGGCCDWCRAVAGTYIYPNVPKDVYRRHQRCRCTVDYHPGDGKVQNVHSKIWSKARIAEDTIEYMGQANIYETNIGGKKYAIKAYKNDNYDNVWCQTYSNSSQKMCGYLNDVVKSKYPGVKQIVVAKNKTLQGIAAYDYNKKILFISEELINEENFFKIVDKGFFAAENLEDILVHELGGHKRHWEAVERYYQINACKSLIDAKLGLELHLREYVVSQMKSNPFYLREIVSKNAYSQFVYKKVLNECIADATILIERNKLRDPNLLRLIEEVINYDGKSN